MAVGMALPLPVYPGREAPEKEERGEDGGGTQQTAWKKSPRSFCPTPLGTGLSPGLTLSTENLSITSEYLLWNKMDLDLVLATHLRAEQSWLSHLVSLSVAFLICKIEKIIVTSSKNRPED